MGKTNYQLRDDLIGGIRDLLTTHVLGQSRVRTRRLNELCYLLDAYLAGQDIVVAKLAYRPEEYQVNLTATRKKMRGVIL